MIVEILHEIGVDIPIENIVGGGGQDTVDGPHERKGLDADKFTPTGKPDRRGSKDITIMEYIKPHAEREMSGSSGSGGSNSSGSGEQKSTGATSKNVKKKPTDSSTSSAAESSSIARVGNEPECEGISDCMVIMGGKRKRKTRRKKRKSRKKKTRRRRRGGKRKSRKTKKSRKKTHK